MSRANKSFTPVWLCRSGVHLIACFSDVDLNYEVTKVVATSIQEGTTLQIHNDNNRQTVTNAIYMDAGECHRAITVKMLVKDRNILFNKNIAEQRETRVV